MHPLQLLLTHMQRKTPAELDARNPALPLIYTRVCYYKLRSTYVYSWYITNQDQNHEGKISLTRLS